MFENFSVIVGFFGADIYQEAITAEHLAGGNLLTVKGSDGRRRETAVSTALDNARRNKNTMQVVLISDAEAEHMEQAFLPYLRYISNPNGKNEISGGEGSKLRAISNNLWFVVDVSGVKKIENIPTTIAEAATLLDIKYAVTENVNNAQSEAVIGFGQLDSIVSKSQNKYNLSEDLWKKIDAVEEYANVYSPYRIGNKLCLQLERGLAVALDCGYGDFEALDSTMAANLIPVLVSFLNGKVGPDEKSLIELLDQLFGEEKLPACRRVLTGIATANN